MKAGAEEGWDICSIQKNSNNLKKKKQKTSASESLKISPEFVNFSLKIK